jgi:hypothetical protein
LASVIDSSTRKSASSRDKVATAGLEAGAEGAAGVDGGAACDGFVMGEAFAYASLGPEVVKCLRSIANTQTRPRSPQCRS